MCASLGPRTLALGRSDSPFYRSIRSAMFVFGEVRYRAERLFPGALGLGSYLRRHRIDQVLMPNPYGNAFRLACYRRLRASRFPVIACDRGALPDSWFFDRGFLADSSSYRAERWDLPLTESERADVSGYIAQLRESARALEFQGPRRAVRDLRESLGIPPNHRVLFVPLQRPHDTAVVHFSSGHDAFERLVQDTAALLAVHAPDWTVVVKQHPLESGRALIPGTRIAEADVHVHDLLALADATLTLTSGVGLLSLLFGNPTFHAGRAFYGQLGLSRAVTTPTDAVRRIVTCRPPDAATVQRFVHHLRTRVYSFGEAQTRLVQDKRSRWRRVTDGIRFRRLVIRGEVVKRSSGERRVLVVAPVSPWPADRGSASRIDSVLRAIERQGATLSLCCLTDQPASEHPRLLAAIRSRYPKIDRVELVTHPGAGVARLRREGRRTLDFLTLGVHRVDNRETCPPALRDRVRELCAAVEPTHLWINYAKLTPAIPREYSGVRIVDTHDCQTRLVKESQRYAGTRRIVSRVLHERSERAALAQYHRVVAIHPGEAKTFRAWVPQAEVVFVPHFTPAEPLPAITGAEAEHDAFFLGSGSSFNVLALKWLLADILPRVRARIPGYRLVAVGRMTDDRRIPSSLRRRARLLGRVEELDAVYRTSHVVVAPIRAGAGMKTKVIEAMARRRPVICTSVAADGIGLEHGVSAWLADDAEGLADGMVRLHEDRALWRRLAAGGAELHARQYAPNGAARSIEALLRPLDGAKGGSP